MASEHLFGDRVLEQFGDQALVRRYEYGDRAVVAVDFGPGASPAVDVVGDTVIIVVGGDQREIELPSDAVEAFNRNGVVTIEVNR